HADHRQIPVWLGRMGFTHAVEDAGNLLKPMRRQTVLHDGAECLLVGVDTGREPERSASKPAYLVTRTGLKSHPAQCTDDSREMSKVGMWMGVCPARYRVGAEGQGDYSHSLVYIWCRNGRYRHHLGCVSLHNSFDPSLHIRCVKREEHAGVTGRLHDSRLTVMTELGESGAGDRPVAGQVRSGDVRFRAFPLADP